MKTCLLVKVEVFSDALGVGEDLRRERVLFFRYVAGLLEQRQIDVGLDVALSAWITVPVPGSAEIARLFDDTDVGDANFLQPRRGQHAAKASADDHGVELFIQRRAGEARVNVGIRIVVFQRACDLLILIVAVGAQALVAFGGVLPTQFGWVEAQFCGSWDSFVFCFVCGFTHRTSTPFRLVSRESPQAPGRRAGGWSPNRSRGCPS